MHVLFFVLIAQASTMPPTGASAAEAAPPVPRAEAISSINFLLVQPRIRAKGKAVRVEGSACRRPNRSLISPSRVRIDHLSSAGELIETSYAYLPRLSQREDQRCGRYGATLKSPPQQPGELVRVCLPQSRGPCGPPR